MNRASEDGGEKQTRVGLKPKKEENLTDWYSQVILQAELTEYHQVSDHHIIKPWSIAVWETIKDWFNAEIKKLCVENYVCIPVSVASEMVVGSTAETVMYPMYAKLIRSYRDLPIKSNEWHQRREFNNQQPFLSTTEFLWQEGHTAYASQKEADAEVKMILDLYTRIYTDLLAIPVVKGRKTEKEKLALSDYTLTVEAFVSASGKAIQGGTSHSFGQNFSKIFDIMFEDPATKERKYVYQNSWELTSRAIGAMIMIHSDNQGLVLPPRVASVQVVVIPCEITEGETVNKTLKQSCDKLEEELENSGIKVKVDYRSYSRDWKLKHWELKGVPILLELGPNNKEVFTTRRDTGAKLTIARNSAVQKLNAMLLDIQNNLLQKATKDLNDHLVTLKDWNHFSANLNKKNLILAPFCGGASCEENIKADSARGDNEPEAAASVMGAVSLCIPLEQPAVVNADKCIHPACTKKPKFYTLFGHSY